MADWFEGDFSNPYRTDPYEGGTEATDYPKAFGARSVGMVGDLGAVVRSLGESEMAPNDKANEAYTELGKAMQGLFGDLEKATIDDMTPEAKRQLQSSFSDPNFWSLSSMALKATNMAPDVVAAVVPSAIFPGIGTAVAISAAQGGVLNAASVVDDLYAMTDELPDADLQKQAKLYREMREGGMDEGQARAEYNEVLRGYRPLITGVVGAITNTFGPAGQAARTVAGAGGSVLSEAGEGVLKRTGKGFLEGSTSEAIQEGSVGYSVQSGAVEGGLQDEVDWGQVAEGAATGAVLGGVLGGGISSVSGGRTTGDETVDSVLVSPPAESTTAAPNVDNVAPPEMAAPPSASGTEATPGVPDEVAAIPEGPTVAQEMQARKNVGTDYGSLTPEQQTTVDGKLTARGLPTAVVEAAAPDPAQTVALETATAPVTTAPAPVTPEGNVTPEVTPPVTQEATPAPAPVSEVPSVETPAPVQQTVHTPEPAPAPVMAEPAPIEAPIQTPTPEPVVTPTGARILEDVSPTGRQAAMEVAAAQDKQLDNNMSGIAKTEELKQKAIKGVVTDEQENVPAKRSAKDRADAIESKAKAKAIVEAHKGTPEEHGVFGTNVAKSVTARNAVLNRAKAIVGQAKLDGVKINTKLKDNADQDFAPTADDVIITEAQELVKAHTAAKAAGKELPMSRYQTFITREFALRQGDTKDVLNTRRAEGDAAKKQGAGVTDETADIDADDASNVEYDDDGEAVERIADEESNPDGNPEDRVIAAQEGNGAEIQGTTRRVAAKVAAMEEGEGYTVPKAERKAPVVVAAKKRNKIAAPKIADIKERLAKKQENIPTPVKAEEPVTTEGNAPKLASVKERVAKARSETNTAPTAKQVETGNYKKGRVSINGVPVAIENPKGSVRSNKNPNGPKWKVTMPADYGYVEGTVGADGDPIDVFLGPDHDATYVYVLDQLDAQTGAFDEHKVLMGFDTPMKALRAYDRSFSDGLGMVRAAGSMRKMTIAEFKAWAATDPKERASMSDELAREAIMSALIDPEVERDVKREAAFNKGAVRDGFYLDPISHRVAKPLATRSAADVMLDLDLSDLRGAERAIAGNARATLIKLVGDVDVHILTPDDVARLSNVTIENAPFGYHIATRDGGDVIVVRADLLNNPAKLRHTVLHEAVHAATVRAIVTDRRLATNIKHIADYVYDYVLKNGTDADLETIRNPVRNQKEFIAEVFSKVEFQRVLANIPAPPQVVEYFKLDQHKVSNMWDALVSTVRRALGLPTNGHTMLEASIRLTEDAMRPVQNQVDTMALLNGDSFLRDGEMSALVDSMKDSLDSLKRRRELAPTAGNPALLGFRTFDSIARAADRYFGGNKVVRRIADLIEGQRVAATKEFDAAAPTIQTLHELSRKYKGKVWEDFTSLVHDETMAGVFADRPLSDQKHISKQGAQDSWQRAQHPDLAKRFDALPADLKAARAEAMEYFTKKQNELSLKNIRNRIVTLFDTTDPEGLAKRIHENDATDADKELLGEAYDTIAAAGVFSKISGPYFPLMRRGNFVVKGRNKVTTPGNATKIADNEFEFKDRDAAANFAAAQSGRPSMRTIHVDKQTGERFGVDGDGKKVRLTANDMNAEPRYRVVVQDRFVEMFDTMREARDMVAAMRAKGIDADDAVPRQFEGYGVQLDALSTQMRRMMDVMERRADARGMTPEQKHELVQSMTEASLAMLGSTRIQSRSLPRQYVAGASKDLVRNITDYAHASGNYIAKLDYRPQLDAELEGLAKAVKDGGRDGFQAGRTAIQNEVLRRITTPNVATENKAWNGLSSRILTASFVDKLMSPTYSLINALQPMMTTTPYLAAHYGAGKAYAAMAKAYSDIGSLSVLKHGVAETIDKAKPGHRLMGTDPVSLIKGRLKNKGEQALIDILIERGALDTDSGLEVHKLAQTRKGIVGGIDTGLGYLEGIARQMPKTVEAINRSVTAIAAYRLEMARSGDQARAVQFAQDTINLTQFNYSTSNSAPFMNHPVLRLALQFKKYGMSMYQLLGEQAAIAWRNENPGDRATALKALSYTIGMHVLVAGAMGLPTEPIKLVVTAANGLGLVDWNWADVENGQREAMADLFGKEFGEIVSRGVPRAMGIDLSSRMGIDTLMGPFGEPRSNEAQDWKAYVWDSVAGAPAGLVTDWAKGVNDLAQGDFVRAAERLIPVKALSDSIKAYRTFTEGNVSERSGKQTMEPYTAGQALVRAFGFTPAKEAESYERAAAFHRGSDVQTGQRQEFQREWVESNGAARGRLWREIVKWNKGQAPEARITISELRGYQKRMQRDMQETKEGIRARRREQHILDRADATFNN